MGRPPAPRFSVGMSYGVAGSAVRNAAAAVSFLRDAATRYLRSAPVDAEDVRRSRAEVTALGEKVDARGAELASLEVPASLATAFAEAAPHYGQPGPGFVSKARSRPAVREARRAAPVIPAS